MKIILQQQLSDLEQKIMETNIQLAGQEKHLRQALQQAFPAITEQKTTIALTVIEQSLDNEKQDSQCKSRAGRNKPTSRKA